MEKNKNILLTICAYLDEECGPSTFKEIVSNSKNGGLFRALQKKYQKNMSMAEQFLNKLQKFNIGYLCVWEEGYPTRLKNYANPPIILFYRGNIDLLKKHVVSIVGTRSCTELGKQYAKEFTQELVQYFVIASGLARGIDSIANKISAEYFEKSIAVLPGSLINPYPISNKYIFDKILKNGGLALSEFPFEEIIFPGAFIARNRIIAGIAEDVLLIESAKQGGSLSTCRIANQYNSQVYAIPANLGLKTFEGNNALIRNQTASIITSPLDIVEDRKLVKFTAKSKRLNKIEKRVLSQLKQVNDFDSICLTLKDEISFEALYDIMLNLEMNGIISRDISGRYLVI